MFETNKLILIKMIHNDNIINKFYMNEEYGFIQTFDWTKGELFSKI